MLALKELKVRGEIRNPVEYLVQLLETDDFKSNNIDTSWCVVSVLTSSTRVVSGRAGGRGTTTLRA